MLKLFFEIINSLGYNLSSPFPIKLENYQVFVLPKVFLATKYTYSEEYHSIIWVSSAHFSHSVVSDSANPWTPAHQASLSITSSRSLLKLMSMELVMPFNNLILCHPLLLLPSMFLSIRVFSSESVLHITWPKFWSFSFNIGPSDE